MPCVVGEGTSVEAEASIEGGNSVVRVPWAEPLLPFEAVNGPVLGLIKNN